GPLGVHRQPCRRRYDPPHFRNPSRPISQPPRSPCSTAGDRQIAFKGGLMATQTQTRVVLEPEAQKVAEAFSKPPFLYEMEPAAARKVLEDAQAGPIEKQPVDEEWITMPSPAGDVRVRLIRPQGATAMLPVILYMHGGGWILGDAATPDRLVRELAVGSNAALAFVEYPKSPEAKYPIAIEQGYATAQWITREGASKNLDASRLAVAGESVGGDMTAALSLMAKQRGDVKF